MKQKKRLFGTDGIRGKANCYPMEPELILNLGRAAAAVFKNGNQKQRIVIGKDTRLSGYMLETALSSGICSMGADVMLVGPLPTPAIAFITRSMRADAGIVISASHNSYDDNGIKFFDRFGYKLPDSMEREMESLVQSKLKDIQVPQSQHIGRAWRIDDAQGRYIQFLKNAFPHKLNLSGFRIVLDCAHGAAYKAAPLVLEELGAEVITLGITPDGININDGCGSLHPEKMCQLVQMTGADVGIALDGDADRLIMCDEKGHIIDGDAIMALAAINLKKRGKLKNDTVVATVMSNLALDAVLNDHDIRVCRAGVGDRHVIAMMREYDANLGGEQSGHMIFLDHNTTGDGVVGALKILEIMKRDDIPLSMLATVFDPYPQVNVNVEIMRRLEFDSIPELSRAVNSYKTELGDDGRLLIRYSGTENIARVMVEGKNYQRVDVIANEIAGLISSHLN